MSHPDLTRLIGVLSMRRDKEPRNRRRLSRLISDLCEVEFAWSELERDVKRSSHGTGRTIRGTSPESGAVSVSSEVGSGPAGETQVSPGSGDSHLPFPPWARHYGRLLALEWMVRDFVWLCPDIPGHPTAKRLVAYFEDAAPSRHASSTAGSSGEASGEGNDPGAGAAEHRSAEARLAELLSLVAQPELRELLEHRRMFTGEWDIRVNGALKRLLDGVGLLERSD